MNVRNLFSDCWNVILIDCVVITLCLKCFTFKSAVSSIDGYFLM